jgi:predicted TIM-barrel fold metal-dependent hydrolase
MTIDVEPCLAHGAQAAGGMLATPLPAVDEAEGAALPGALPPVVDAHVHVFERALFEAIWRWFDRWGWPIRYRLGPDEVVAFLRARGVRGMVLLHYAHKPGIARRMNAFVAEIARRTPGAIGLATVHPDDADPAGVLAEGFAAGLRGVKLHCHVQCFAPDDPRLVTVYEACVRNDVPLVVHAGREPKSPGYKCDPHALCSADRIEQVLRGFPRLRVCVPHLGADEFEPYERLVTRHDNLWLDTTMAVGGYLPGRVPWRLVRARPERIVYGTDFPNLPYAWDREVLALARAGLPDEALERVLSGSASELFARAPFDASPFAAPG